MPLSGLVPVQSSHRFRQIQQAQQNQATQQKVNWTPDGSSCNSPKRPSSRQEIWIDGDFAEQTNSNKVRMVDELLVFFNEKNS